MGFLAPWHHSWKRFSLQHHCRGLEYPPACPVLQSNSRFQGSVPVAGFRSVLGQPKKRKSSTPRPKKIESQQSLLLGIRVVWWRLMFFSRELSQLSPDQGQPVTWTLGFRTTIPSPWSFTIDLARVASLNWTQRPTAWGASHFWWTIH